MHDIIAVVFDFDDTLAPDSTSGWLRRAGLDTGPFWKQEVGDLLAQDWDPVPAYLYKMIEQSRRGAMPPLTREDLRAWGRELPLHPSLRLVRVPPADVRERDLDAHAALDELGDLLHSAAEVAGRVLDARCGRVPERVH